MIVEIGDIKTGRELGYLNSNKHVWMPCKVCGKERWVSFVKGKPSSERCRLCAYASVEFRKNMSQSHVGIKRSMESRRKQGISIRREKHHAWKGGRIGDGFGYLQIRMYEDNPYFGMTNKRGYVKEQRLVMAEYLNRCLRADEFVHHKNGIRTDNRVVNLALVSISNHPRQTLLKLMQRRICDLENELAQSKLLTRRN